MDTVFTYVKLIYYTAHSAHLYRYFGNKIEVTVFINHIPNLDIQPFWSPIQNQQLFLITFDIQKKLLKTYIFLQI